MNRTLSGRVTRLEREIPAADWRTYIGKPLREWPGDAFAACCEAAYRFEREAQDALARITDAELEEMIAADTSALLAAAISPAQIAAMDCEARPSIATSEELAP